MASITLLVEFSVKAAFRSEFLSVMQEHAAATRREPGCLQFRIIAPTARMDDRVFLFEEWKDQAALDWHLEHSALNEVRKRYDAWIFARHIIHGTVVGESAHA